MTDFKAMAAFQRECARYFRNRPTNGEDSAYWANLANAENCERSALMLEGLALPSDVTQVLKQAEHALITTDNLRATDLTEERIQEYIKDTRCTRDKLEWMTDNEREITAIGDILKKYGR